MNDDLQAWVRGVRTADDEHRARVAGTLSVVAIILLLITNVTVANRDPVNAAPQVVAIPPPLFAVAAPYTPCQKLRNGAWLRSEIAQQSRDGWVIACSYWGQELMTRDEVIL